MTCADRPSFMAIGALRLGIKYVYRLGPARLRRGILDMIPHAALQKLKGVVDTMERESTAVYRAKKRAFEKGDAAVLEQIGEGKDIMSKLSTL